jgi:adiponectin receptor
MFVICGLLAGVPTFHIEHYTDPLHVSNFSTVPWAIGGALYIIGAIIYMMKIPERFIPKRFDYFVIYFIKFTHYL